MRSVKAFPGYYRFFLCGAMSSFPQDHLDMAIEGSNSKDANIIEWQKQEWLPLNGCCFVCCIHDIISYIYRYIYISYIMYFFNLNKTYSYPVDVYFFDATHVHLSLLC